MQSTERAEFANLLDGVYGFYGKDLSPFSLDVWWQGMRQFGLDEVRAALGRHCMNPDTGQYLPKPADVVRMLGGTTLDAAMLAWTKLMDAYSGVGSYASVCFDDAIINAVVLEMGGWIDLGRVIERELPFKQKEFETRYRAHALRGVRTWPGYLPGITERENSARGLPVPPPVYIGDHEKAQAVMARGSERVLLAHVAHVLPAIAAA